MKVFVFIMLLFSSFFVHSQNSPIAFGLDNLPQNTLLNPAFYPNAKYYIGSDFYLDIGATGINLYDLFGKSGGNFTNKVTKAIAKLNSDDILSINSKANILNLGYRIDETLFVNGGFYVEADFFSYFPKDIAILIHQGNANYLGKSFRFNDLAMKGDLLGVLHFGASKKVNEDITIGGRLKIYSSSVNLLINKSRGSFLTERGSNNLLKHYLDNFNIEVNTSGVFVNKEINKDVGSFVQNTFLKGNSGFGIDLGFSYKINKSTMFSASLVDVGYISYTNDTRNYKISGSYTFEGINLLYDNNSKDYWKNLEDDFDEKVPSGQNFDTYTSWRPIKFFSLLKHNYGKEERRLRCFNNDDNSYYKNSVGLQLFAVKRPLSMQTALTGFYERRFLENTTVKLAYTVNDYAATNIGVGLTTRLGPLNVFATVDNVLSIKDVSTAQSVSLQVGINVIFDKNE